MGERGERERGEEGVRERGERKVGEREREEREREDRGERRRVWGRKGNREHKDAPFWARSWCSMGRGSGRGGGGGAEGCRTPKMRPKRHVFGVQGKGEQEGRWRHVEHAHMFYVS